MTLTRNNPQSWLDTLWEAIWAYEDTFADAMDADTSDKIDDIKTAMAWITESLGLDDMPYGEALCRNGKPMADFDCC
jgi:hypothetical protein